MSTAPHRVYAAAGRPLYLDKELGRGNEGSVHTVQGQPSLVAKVYHRPKPEQDQKLRLMVAARDARLERYVAWPTGILTEQPGGPVIGFVMPKVADRNPSHLVYSPAHRKQDMPGIKWDFLVLAARNLAAAVDTVHSHGYVIGDLNQNGVLIGADATVHLIDSDSFQVRGTNQVFRSLVGVPEFTSPELQNVRFDSQDRSPNHDAFGLAVLIFQLLMCGRHPFAGVPLTAAAGDDMGADIRASRYAYAHDSHIRGLTAPPTAPPLSLLPDELQAMFYQAFTEDGKRLRPKAKQWVAGLDRTRRALHKCQQNPAHVFPQTAARCPWCTLDATGVSYFELPVTVQPDVAGQAFDIHSIWAQIEQVHPPQLPPLQSPDPSAHTPAPLPAGVISKQLLYGLHATVAVSSTLLIVVGVAFLWPLVLLPLAITTEAVLLLVYGRRLKTERAKRRAEHETAEANYAALQQQDRANREHFTQIKTQLQSLRATHTRLQSDEAAALADAKATAHQRLLDRHLQRCFIDRAQIPTIGPGRMTSLRSFGIETAYDISASRVQQIPGFGEGLTSRLLGWRATCERRFVFNPSDPSLKTDEDRVRVRFASQRTTVQNRLLMGGAGLHAARESSEKRSQALAPAARAAANHVGQSLADLSKV